MGWSESQQLALAIVPKFSSVLSLLGSSWVAIEVLSDKTAPTPKRQQPYHRLLLAMSIYDILESVFNFMSTWPIPKDTEGVWDPRGTTATCTAQGFFLTLSVAVPIYNAFLSLYYVLVINYRYTETQLRRRVEPAMHIFAFVFAFGTALTSAWMGLINNANLWCWIAPYPAGCLDSRRHGEDGNCERGDNAWIYRWAFYFAPLWFCIFFATVCTFVMAYKVHSIDKTSLKYRRPEASASFHPRESTVEKRPSFEGRRNSRGSFSNSFIKNIAIVARGFQHDSSDSEDEAENNRTVVIEGLEQIAEEDDNGNGHQSPRNLRTSLRNSVANTMTKTTERFHSWHHQREEYVKNHQRSAEVFRQAVWFLVVFYSTHVWSTTNRIIQQRNNGETYFGLILCHSWFDPLQGFTNFLVYQRPRYIKERKNNPRLSRWQTICRVLRFSIYPPPAVEVSVTMSAGHCRSRGTSSNKAFVSEDDLSEDNFVPSRRYRSRPYSIPEEHDASQVLEVDENDDGPIDCAKGPVDKTTEVESDSVGSSKDRSRYGTHHSAVAETETEQTSDAVIDVDEDRVAEVQGSKGILNRVVDVEEERVDEHQINQESNLVVDVDEEMVEGTQSNTGEVSTFEGAQESLEHPEQVPDVDSNCGDQSSASEDHKQEAAAAPAAEQSALVVPEEAVGHEEEHTISFSQRDNESDCNVHVGHLLTSGHSSDGARDVHDC